MKQFTYDVWHAQYFEDGTCGEIHARGLDYETADALATRWSREYGDAWRIREDSYLATSDHYHRGQYVETCA